MQNVQNMQNMQNMKKCAKYTEYAKPVNAWVRSTFSYVFYLGKLSQSHQQAILMSNSPMKCTLDFYSMPASASGWGQQSISSLALCLEYLVFKELLCHFSHKMNQKEAKKRTPPRQEPGCDTPWWAGGRDGAMCTSPRASFVFTRGPHFVLVLLRLQTYYTSHLKISFS